MYKKAKPFFIKVISPLHAGSGQELGIVDMPIQRERHTDFPKIEGSGLKGSIREVFEEQKNNIPKKLKDEFKELNNNGKEYEKAISLAFGPEKGDEHTGALGFTDSRILLFPVKSMKGVFAYITCPIVLNKFKNELELCNDNIKGDDASKTPEGDDSHRRIQWDFPSNDVLKPENDKGKCLVAGKNELEINGNVILEEYAFEIVENNITNLAKFISDYSGVPDVEKKLIILSDDDFKDFVNLSTEVITRTKISAETGTVEKGQLFTEEYLPAETVMYSLALTTPIFNSEKGIFKATDTEKEEDKVMNFFEKGIPEIMQIGGNATIGKGIVQIKVWEEKNDK